MDETDSYFSREFGISKETIRRVMSDALSRGGDFADLYFQHASGFSVGFEDGAVNRAGSLNTLGVGIRVVANEQTGYAFSEDLSLAAMCDAARTAAGIAATGSRNMPSDWVFPKIPRYYDPSSSWSSTSMESIKSLLEDIAEKTHSRDNRIVRLNQSFGSNQDHIMIVDSEGRVLCDSRPMTRIFLSVTMEQGGITQANSYNLAAREGFGFYSEDRIETLITTALDRTSILFESGRPPAGEMPVILAAGSAGILLHEAIGHGMEADFNRKGVSIFADKMGQRVAIDDVTIVDDGTNRNCRGSINFDDEGRSSEATRLVERGVLKSYLHDRISAHHYGVAETGNGRRQSFRHVPMPRMRNTYMLAGQTPKDELVRAVKNGVFCESFTNGQVNIGAGDYSFYVKNGYLIEDGKLTQPIKDVNIIGNGPQSLERISMVGDDFKMDESGWTCGKDGQSVPVSLGMPSVLVDKVVVGGAS